MRLVEKVSEKMQVCWILHSAVLNRWGASCGQSFEGGGCVLFEHFDQHCMDSVHLAVSVSISNFLMSSILGKWQWKWVQGGRSTNTSLLTHRTSKEALQLSHCSGCYPFFWNWETSFTHHKPSSY